MTMRTIRKFIKKLVADERGLETVEYAIIAGLITVAAIATITAVGVLVHQKFQSLETAMGGGSTP
ncbi:MAG TPA: Flp family type IVb pilin [Phycisphaerae bacterium]|nr:Flp family type IVb pilin [Phycisphaerae bacterium]HDZ42473.1 Flp family type IVb pilin [Phycisphaerae bacterium]